MASSATTFSTVSSATVTSVTTPSVSSRWNTHLLFGVEPLGEWPARLLRCETNRYRYFGRDQDYLGTTASVMPSTSRTTTGC
jgi:hypothetical protein